MRNSTKWNVKYVLWKNDLFYYVLFNIMFLLLSLLFAFIICKQKSYACTTSNLPSFDQMSAVLTNSTDNTSPGSTAIPDDSAQLKKYLPWLIPDLLFNLILSHNKCNSDNTERASYRYFQYFNTYVNKQIIWQLLCYIATFDNTFVFITSPFAIYKEKKNMR